MAVKIAVTPEYEDKKKIVPLKQVTFVFVAKKLTALTRLAMSVTTQGGSGRQFVTGPGRNIFKYRSVLLNVYNFRET